MTVYAWVCEEIGDRVRAARMNHFVAKFVCVTKERNMTEYHAREEGTKRGGRCP